MHNEMRKEKSVERLHCHALGPIAAMTKKPIIIGILFVVSMCMRMQYISADGSENTTIAFWHDCGDIQYENGSIFQHNLNQVLDSLVGNIYLSRFKTSIKGQNTNSTVYGLAQCRGDSNSSECDRCASKARSKLVGVCHNTSGAIQLNSCFLRYDNHSFYGVIESTQTTVRCSHGSSAQPVQFATIVSDMLLNITTKATHSAKLFAADIIPVPSSTDHIYSLAQCWRDLSPTSCQSCLASAFSNLIKRCQTGALGATFGSVNCYLRYDIKKFFNTSILSPSPDSKNGSIPSPSPLPSPRENRQTSKKKLLGIIVGLIVGVGLTATISLWKWKFSSRWKPPERISGTRDEEKQYILSSTISNKELFFDYNILKKATSNFRVEDKLGEGGFGSVFKGILPDGREVAVKRLNINSKQGDIEFINEANLISCVQHRNLVKLIGCSVEHTERLLVYEYLPIGSLDKILFDARKRQLLDWKKRYEIIVGTARGLAYLHEESEIRIIHRDIKASNILLDHKHKPKIADFGLAKLFGEDQSHISTRVAGTLGYMAPEYALRGQLTEKADVFSFGVLLLEIISGRKSQSSAENMEFLIERTWRLYKEERTLEVMDPTLKGSYSWEEGIKVIKIGLLCMQATAASRPSMSRVVSMLTSEREHPPSPTRPAFIDLDSVAVPHQIIDVREQASNSTATSSMTPSDTHSAAADPSSGTLEPR